MRLRFCATTLSALVLLSSGGCAWAQSQPTFNQPGFVQGNGPGEGGFPPPEYIQGQQVPPHAGQMMNAGQGGAMMQGQQQMQQQMQPQTGAPGQQPMMGGQMQPGMPQGMPNGGFQQPMNQPMNQGSAIKVNPQQAAKVYQWFLKYDEIRRRAQMDPIEKQRADGLLARGFGLFMPGQDKVAAKQLLGGLVQKYQVASQSLQAMPPLKETQQLHEMYFQYFDTAMHLFSDYMKVQDNVFAVDNTGQSIAKQLIQRKMALENLEHACKDLDYRMRQSYGVAPYQF